MVASAEAKPSALASMQWIACKKDKAEYFVNALRRRSRRYDGLVVIEKTKRPGAALLKAQSPGFFGCGFGKAFHNGTYAQNHAETSDSDRAGMRARRRRMR